MWLAFEFLQEDLWSYLKNSAPEGLSFATSRVSYFFHPPCPMPGFSITTIQEYLRQLLGAIDYCHRNQILHRDVKPGVRHSIVAVDEIPRHLLSFYYRTYCWMVEAL